MPEPIGKPKGVRIGGARGGVGPAEQLRWQAMWENGELKAKTPNHISPVAFFATLFSQCGHAHSNGGNPPPLSKANKYSWSGHIEWGGVPSPNPHTAHGVSGIPVQPFPPPDSLLASVQLNFGITFSIVFNLERASHVDVRGLGLTFHMTAKTTHKRKAGVPIKAGA